MIQTRKYLSVLAALEGTKKASGTFVPLRAKDKMSDSQIREWTPKSNSLTWVDPHRAGRGGKGVLGPHLCSSGCRA